MHVCLFEDRAQRLEPLSLTRPVFDLRCGISTLGQKQFRHVAAKECGVLVRPYLEELYRQENPATRVNDPDWLQADDLLLVNGLWLPPREPFERPWQSCIGLADDGIAYVLLRKGEIPPLTLEQLPELLDHWLHTLPARPTGGQWIHYPWDLVERNAGEIRRDFAWLTFAEKKRLPSTLMLSGSSDQLWIAPSAQIEPMVVADTTQGPVIIDAEAIITAFTRLEGPCYIGPQTQVFGAKIRGGTTLGPQCRVGGEVEASILHGHSNKHHDGFLGHSYIGAWTNLGAGTHNSDLRNDYGEVSIPLRGKMVPTGMNKAGCFLGDHTKTGLGTLINTGTSIGAFCNLLPAGRFAPKYVPSFTSWWNGALREAFPLEQLLTTAQIAMQRRGVTLGANHRALYAWLLADTEQERRRVLRDSEQHQLRRSA